MKFTIDNLDDLGPRDYTQFVAAENLPKIVRKLNRPSRMTVALVGTGPAFRVPARGARVSLERSDGTRTFTGYLEASPDYEYLGVGECGAVYRYHLRATGEEYLLDRKAAVSRAPFSIRSAGAIVKELAEDLCPGLFNTEGVKDVATIARFRSTPARKWSDQVGELALRARATYRVHDGQASLAPIGETVHLIDDKAEGFCPESLRIERLTRMLNDVTVAGRWEPGAYVKDYFVGDGYTLRYSLSEMPFLNRASTLVEEEYEGDALRPEYWTIHAGAESLYVVGGKLRVNDASGPAATQVSFVEQVELGAASHLQHGELEFTAASAGIVGGLFSPATARDEPHCVAGFRVNESGAQSTISALVGGALTGASVTTVPGHKYVLSTRVYADAIYRVQQSFHSSDGTFGGAEVPSGVRLVLEVHDIDPSNPASVAAPSKILFDGVLRSAPAFCGYSLVSGSDLHCRISYTRLRRIADVQVRSALSGQAARPRLVGPLSEGGECSVSSEPALYFYAAYPPAPNETLVASYRSGRKSLARLLDEGSIASEVKLNDDGVRSAVIEVVVPEPRTTEECANAARAVLADCTRPAWRGEYQTWTSELENDVCPGEGVRVRAPTRRADFSATVREVEIEMRDPESDLAKLKMTFANDAAEPLAYEFQQAKGTGVFDARPLSVNATETTVPDLPAAEVKTISSTFVTLDAGATAQAGGGFEVRRSDFGWGATNDRNLIGRFTSTTFSVPRLSRVQDYWMRMYDAEDNYSQHSTLLHIDYPL